MKTKLFSLFLVLAASVGTMFAEKVQIGDLYYLLDRTNHTAEVTYKSYEWDETTNTVTINVDWTIETAVIPASVIYKDRTYRVTGIGRLAFDDCSNLKSVEIANGVTSIGERAFSGCTITNISFPNSLTSIDESAFKDCKNLTSITINSATSIGMDAFGNCTALKSVTLNGVTSIACGAFSECVNLTSVNIPNSVTSIEGYAFYGCTNLTSVNIPNSVTSIKHHTFCDCSSLTSITIPNSVTSIGYEAFYQCTNLKSVIIPNRVTNIEEYAFAGCTSLYSISIPNSVTTIRTRTFQDCPNLKKVILPNSLKSIKSMAFDGCSSLSNVTIGKNMEIIEYYAFGRCDNLSSITCKAANPPSLDRGEGYNEMINSFGRIDDKVVYVPAGSVKAYTDDNQWNIYTIKAMGAIPTYTVTFLNWNGTVLHTETVEEGDGAKGPATDPTREGYDFAGWDKTIGNISENTTATARFDPHFSTVTFLDWDGTELHKELVEYGKEAIGPAFNPYREGYNFIRWDKPITNIKTDLTVTAQYEQYIFTVTFLDWDGTKLLEETVEKGKDAKGPDKEPYREEYNFTGWDKPITNITADLTVTAQYEIAIDEVYGLLTHTEDLWTEKRTYTLTLYYNKKRSKYGGKTDWYEYNTKVHKVVLDESMRDARPTSLANWFKDCHSLREITNLDYLNVSEVENMDYMFYNCSSLRTIECNNNWKTSSAVSSTFMFKGCTSLVGGNGTEYDENNVSILYAHPDKVGNPGYFTAYEEVIENEELTGLFTVNSSGKQVVFSKGNLQYKASINEWQFAPNQYAIIGEKNKNIAADYNGWIDLFGWGTGNNPTQASTNSGAYSTFTDWGTNSISNGGDHKWHTLSMDEWDYIINQRSADKRGPAVIAGINGFVLLPDEWTLPSGVSFDPTAKKPEDNTYTAEDWQKMEENGAVFLPCAGMRSDNKSETNTVISYPNTLGIYWSSSPYTEDPDKVNYAQTVYIMGQYIMNDRAEYKKGHSVRLVRDYATYTVTFLDWDGTELYKENVAIGEDAKGPATDPARDGYTFNGWDKSLNGVTEDMTVTAQYTINTYKVTLIAEHGTISVKPDGLEMDLVEYGTVLTLTAVPDEGYEFDEWTNYDGKELVVTCDITVTAAFKEVVCHTVFFLDWDGTELFVEKVEHGKDAKGPEKDPTREGYTFTGWSKPLTNITSDLMVVAQYEKKEATAIEDIPAATDGNTASPARKLLRNGILYILRNGKVYTLHGAELR